MTVNASVQFDSFVDFAQKSMTAGSSKAGTRPRRSLNVV